MIDRYSATELAHVVTDHLGRGPRTDLAVATVSSGLCRISSGLNDIQEHRHDWASILRKLRTGVDELEVALAALRTQPAPGFAGLISFAERQRLFAELLDEEVVRRFGPGVRAHASGN